MTNTSFFRKEWLYIVHANSSKVWTTSKTGQEKKRSFALTIYLVNVKQSAESCRFHCMKNGLLKFQKGFY